MAYVLSPDGTRRTVKNLRWLIAHKRDVTRVHINDIGDGGATLTCTFETGVKFAANFADISVCRHWVAKRFAPQIVSGG